jgi:hypothetical protein
VTEFNNDPYSVLFAQFASKLESHLLKHGVACVDADMIIEESSILYFRKLESSKKNFLNCSKDTILRQYSLILPAKSWEGLSRKQNKILVLTMRYQSVYTK